MSNLCTCMLVGLCCMKAGTAFAGLKGVQRIKLHAKCKQQCCSQLVVGNLGAGGQGAGADGGGGGLDKYGVKRLLRELTLSRVDELQARGG